MTIRNITTTVTAFELDTRIRILLAFGAGILALHATPRGLALFLLLAAGFFTLITRKNPANRNIVMACILFTGLWTGIKLLVDIFTYVPVETAIEQSALLGIRLLTLILIGLTLALTASYRKLGLAISWLLRPVLRHRAWQVALALALMLHFLPLTWSTFVEIRRTMSLRAANLSWRQRLTLFPKAAMRVLSQKTWNQTIAIATRGLDDAAAWEHAFSPNFAHWLLGVLLLCLGVAIASL